MTISNIDPAKLMIRVKNDNELRIASEYLASKLNKSISETFMNMGDRKTALVSHSYNSRLMDKITIYSDRGIDRNVFKKDARIIIDFNKLIDINILSPYDFI